ncbi:MAG: tRNA (adenosine(37)-N6)-threonylcarbamoyltransferase complex dimerization subunit type 1 TsaB [Alphaproteobacteria bacterium]|nr:tRNA (adenosine(37)-N6)-threonylcarbamoyltransferase complex dimerization subunit type 1 TsaB [Alphaproteobacteria bacterium]
MRDRLTQPTILALDSATAACSAAVLSGGAIAARRFAPMATGHAQALVPLIETVMAESGVAFAALDHIVVTVGPGAFTGLRVGLAAAQGIALAAGKPIGGITTLEAVAHAVDAGAREGAVLLIAIESKRRELFVQSFAADLSPLDAPAAVPPEDLCAHVPPGGLAVAGDAAVRAAEALAAGGRRASVLADAVHPDAAHVALAAAARLAAGGALLPPRPLYLRPPDVTVARA